MGEREGLCGGPPVDFVESFPEPLTLVRSRPINTRTLAGQLATWSGGVLFVYGLYTLMSYHLGWVASILLFPDTAVMQYNTALGFLLVGVILLTDKPRIRLPAAILLIVMTTLTLGEYLSGLSFGIDELLAKDIVRVRVSHPGRMAPNTAICLLLLGVTSLVVRPLKGTIASIVMAFAATALGGYMLGLESLYGWGQASQMSPQTSLSAFVGALGLAALAWSNEPPENLLPRWLPVPLILFGLVVIFSCREIALIQRGSDPLAWLIPLGGGLCYFLLVSIFILILRESQFRFQEQLATVEERRAEVARFAHAAAHDLREPLRSVVSCLTLLERREKELPEKSLQVLEAAAAGTRRMDALLGAIRQLSGLDEYRRREEPIQLSELFSEVCDDLKTLIAENGATVTYDGPERIQGEPTHLSLLLQNLISNAIYYRKPEESPVIEVCAQTAPGGIQISVSDNGLGIEAEHRELVFEGFRRLHSRAPGQDDGLGLGLALCRRIVRLHEGEIKVRSNSNGGSVFHLFLGWPRD